MKKIVALLLAVLMIATSLFALTSCGAEKVKNSEEKTAENTAEKNDEEGEAVKLPTVKKGKLIMATNAYFQPYEYYEGEKIVGIDAEIAAKIAEKLGLELEIQDMAFDSIITAVSEGSADFGLAGMTVTEDRLKDVDFSISYASGVQSIIVPENSAITNVDDLYAEGAAYKVGVQLGTTGDVYATDDFGDDLVTSYPNGNEAINALLKGDVDCVIIDNEPAKAFVAANQGLKVLETSYADEDYAACIKKGNTALREAIDDAIESLIEDGTIDAIIAKYIK
jgi:polar amino acid transport system substrate-binding protein